jgi:hypothetical protein
MLVPAASNRARVSLKKRTSGFRSRFKAGEDQLGRAKGTELKASLRTEGPANKSADFHQRLSLHPFFPPSAWPDVANERAV